MERKGQVSAPNFELLPLNFFSVFQLSAYLHVYYCYIHAGCGVSHGDEKSR